MISKMPSSPRSAGKRVRAKTFTYPRRARSGLMTALLIAGVAHDGHVATMTVTVTDDGSGNLAATTPARSRR